MNHTGNGYILLDSIVLDIGSLSDDGLVIPLDTDQDKLPVHWTISDEEDSSCAYVEQYSDFQHKLVDCPGGGSPSEDNPFNNNNGSSSTGYWSPCLQKSCKLTFFSGSSVRPTSMTVRGYINGSSAIRVHSSSRIEGDEDAVLVGEISMNATGSEGWQEMEFRFPLYPTFTVRIGYSIS
jgi:hypothetical protein